MSEERMFILKMIEDGKITAEEGAALLEALRDETFGPPGDREKASEEPPADSRQRRVEAMQATRERVGKRKSGMSGPRPREAAESGGESRASPVPQTWLPRSKKWCSRRSKAFPR